MTAQEQPTGFPDWGVPTHRSSPGRAFVVPLLLGALAGLVAGLWAGPPAGVVVAALTASAVTVAVVAGPRRLLQRERAIRADPSEVPRLHNLVAGLSADLGIPAPRIWIAPGQPNAVALRARTPAICVRRDLVESFTRTELEATVAFLLTGLATGAARSATMPRWANPFEREPELALLDVTAVSVTRYPPALASALQRCSPEAPALGLWLVEGRTGEIGRDDRVAALLDL